MPKFRKKPIIVDAHRWFKNGDHPEDGYPSCEGKVVRRFRRPDVKAALTCRQCGRHFGDHGWIDTREGGHIVCVGDWIITGVQGERYPCKPDIFAETYESVDD